jgi:hypothetical protein
MAVIDSDVEIFTRLFKTVHDGIPPSVGVRGMADQNEFFPGSIGWQYPRQRDQCY